ncbi:MAG: NADP-dependent malic enzyme [Deltaproteobacteria bacterium]|jgi:malate dehydrogenase (oxaloacetate-decarboxylating)(NADP+)|nr:NADP-dependent malic enzyme [Deltaproteobacteria bacterium]MBT4639162.1 NADP-dependent malic enzyme [Deltaproteobacteria bacterium]MBT6499265.1 NADP-dependent malic enzyme [Deltaproteobacteria bacterium]MBT7154843.1 NADP-dependent malic enzyme [Deltaproteobacteria bacterium]MBT7715711.1 NADP-dependent malic enzyme [Deltaproteobacteria bacterium]
MLYEKEALHYHKYPSPGKIEVVSTKPCYSQSDLRLAYTPGVAVPCLEIQKNPDLSFDYTARGNLIAVITNGSAVLGLGNIGALAGKPVMEGKAVLFKRFANIDVFDLEINTEDPDEFIRTVKLLEPTFGGINLEDIKAPDCFYIEEQLIKQMSIPVFHDDQHGTAIISGAGLLNACELTDRKTSDIRMVINGAGAAAMACGKIYIQLGVKPENIIFVDSKGVIYQGRTEGMNPYKDAMAVDTPLRTLDEAVEGADMLVGLSVAGAFKAEMLKRMRQKPIIFALANPESEIDYYEAKRIRPDAIVATGRSDFPNQINNVLGFPYIFRGALDVRATTVNTEMKLAAVQALAELAREDVSDMVIRAYGGRPIHFGPEYIIPMALDPMTLMKVTPAVAQAAIDSGVARIGIENRDDYIHSLETRLGPERGITRKMIIRAQNNPKRIVLPEGTNPVILRAAHQAIMEKIAHPIVLGKAEKIEAVAREHWIPLEGIEILDYRECPQYDSFAEKLFQKRSRKGWTLAETKRLLLDPCLFGAMMVNEGVVDGQVHGIERHYPQAIRPVLQAIPKTAGISKVSGVYLILIRNRILFFADATVNVHPSPEDLAEIAILAAEAAQFYGVAPKVAMLSFSNFGSSSHSDVRQVQKAVEICRERRPNLVIDGEMQADTAIVSDILNNDFPFNQLGGPANVLVFPNLAAGNIAHKLLLRLGGAKTIGPLLMGISKPFNVLRRGTDMENVVNVIATTVAQAQELEKANR